jgi:DNA-binding NarL/FixJ family response regulator
VSDLHPLSQPCPPPLYALVVDDHPLVGRGVAEYLKNHAQLGDAMVASHADEVLALIDKLGPPAVMLVDFWLSEGATDRLISLVRSRWPDTKVLVMSGDDNTAIITKARACGAHGFVHKQEAPQVFSDAVHAVLTGHNWFVMQRDTPSNATVGAHGGASHDRTTSQRSARQVSVTPAQLGLTARQGQILAMLLQALPNKRIADSLNVSENTVKEHVTTILTKLAASNRVELITKLRGVHLTEGVFE